MDYEEALPWLRDSPAPVALSYHWLDADTGSMTIFDGMRTLFPEDIYAGGGARVAATVRAPPRRSTPSRIRRPLAQTITFSPALRVSIAA